MKKRIAGCLVVVALLALACSSSGSSDKLDLDGVTVSGTTLGDQGIQVTLYENIGCEACRTFEQQALPKIVENYVKPGKIKITFKHASIGTVPEITFAHEAAECAAEQDKFWQYLDIIYSHQSSEISGKDKLKDYADEAGLDRSTFDPCLDNEETKPKVESDTQQLQTLGPPPNGEALPVFQIDTLLVAGNYSYDGLKFYLDEQLNEGSN